MTALVMDRPTRVTTLRRVLDASRLNTIANAPDVRPWLGWGTGELDLTPLCADVANVTLQTDHGGFVLHQTEPGVYEAHSLFTPEGRGRHALEAARQAVHYIFTQTNGVEMVTKVPAKNAAALGFARLVGFHHRFTSIGTFPHVDGPQNIEAYGLNWQEWALTAPETEIAGQAFHDRLEQLKAQQGATTADHADDPVHDRMAGYCALCVYAGNAAKGVYLYNRWARLAGYQPIALISEHPVVIDIRDAVIALTPDHSFEVVSCR